ncbi:MAG: FAD-binding protein [Gemmatimonadales bacterium]
MNRYSTEVLIVGGGGAATAAAISAHESGARAMLAVKGRFGVPGVRGAGATSNPIGDYWTIRTVGPKGSFFNPPEKVYSDMIQAGLGMADPVLCRIFVDEVSEAVQRLQSMGMRFGNKMLATMEGRSNKQGTNSIVAIQKAIIETTGTAVLEHANLTDLVVDSGRCIGAVGVDDDGDPFVVEAGAVIIATGGVGQLFRYSFNPPGNTGDGYAMALRAGAELFNMEFMQQGLATTWPRQAMIMLYEMEEPYRLLNADGKEFLGNYLPNGYSAHEVSKLKSYHWPVSCRDAAIYLDRAIKGEALAGRGTAHDGIFLDLAHADRGFEPELFVEFILAQGIDVKRDLIQVQIHHHTSNGGIRIDCDAQSTVAGLFAAGEAGGWQGADRLGGTMLGGSQVFGWRAGRKAAEVAKGGSSNIPSHILDSVLEPVCRYREARGRKRPTEMRGELQQTMWETLIVEKDETSLERARRFVADERDRLVNDLLVAEPIDVALAFEHRNLLDVAEVIIEAAAQRTESRGSHVRTDFPERNDGEWLTNLVATRSSGELQLERRRIASDGWVDQPGDIRIKPWG